MENLDSLEQQINDVFALKGRVLAMHKELASVNSSYEANKVECEKTMDSYAESLAVLEDKQAELSASINDASLELKEKLAALESSGVILPLGSSGGSISM